MRWNREEWTATLEAMATEIRRRGGEPRRWIEVFPVAQKNAMPKNRHYTFKSNPLVFRKPKGQMLEELATQQGIILDARKPSYALNGNQKVDWWISLEKWALVRHQEPEPVIESQEAEQPQVPEEEPPAPIEEPPVESINNCPTVQTEEGPPAPNPRDMDMRLLEGLVTLAGDWIREVVKFAVMDAIGTEIRDLQRGVSVIKADMADILLGSFESEGGARRGHSRTTAPTAAQLARESPNPAAALRVRKPIILCWNLTVPQLRQVACNVPEAEIIGNKEDTRIGTSRRVDLVITSKFMKHSQESLLQSRYGKANVKHCTGGTSGMIAIAKKFVESLTGDPT